MTRNRLHLSIKALAGVSVLTIAVSAIAQPTFTPGMVIEKGALEPGSEEWRAAFSVDQHDTRDPSPPQVNIDGATKLTVAYKGKALGLKLGIVYVTAALTDETYEMTYKVQPEGVVRWLDQSEQDVLSYGLLNGRDMTSLYYFRNEREPGKSKQVELTRTAPGERFRYWDADPGGWLAYPVMPEIGLDTVDPLAALALLGFVELEEDVNPCERTVEAYDGRRRFTMRMEPAGTATLKNRGRNRYEGFAYKCRVYMVKVAGYKKKELDEQSAGEGYVYLAPVPEAASSANFTYLPVYLTGKAGMLSASLEAKLPIITLSDGTVINMGRQ